MTALIRASRFISWALRHDPDEAGIVLDAHGWTSVTSLLHSLRAHNHTVTAETLAAIVADDAKGRYTLSDDQCRIRANYAHSVVVDPGPASQPPDSLYHGTARNSLSSIRQHGVLRGTRQFVHLTSDLATAFLTGRRHGRPVAIPIDTHRMHVDGMAFYQGSGSLWMTETVPPIYLQYDGLLFD
jgi:putative RNA 2'-phosphotransferase